MERNEIYDVTIKCNGQKHELKIHATSSSKLECNDVSAFLKNASFRKLFNEGIITEKYEIEEFSFKKRSL